MLKLLRLIVHLCGIMQLNRQEDELKCCYCSFPGHIERQYGNDYDKTTMREKVNQKCRDSEPKLKKERLTTVLGQGQQRSQCAFQHENDETE